jgi:carboxyl-terminal processing protease
MKNIPVILILFVVSLSVSRCSASKLLATPTTLPQRTTPISVSTNTPAPEPTQAFDGYWKSDGLNTIFEIKGNQGLLCEVTQISCFCPALPSASNQPKAQLNQQGSDTYFLGMKLTMAGDKMGVFLPDAPFYSSWSKITELPDLCKNGGTPKTQEPEVNFQVLWHTFQEKYAFFDVRKIDWQAQYDKYQPLVKADMSQSELFSLMSDMIAPLNDSHVFLFSETQGTFIAYNNNPWWINNDQTQTNIINGYLGGPGNITTAGNNHLTYGTLNDKVGYLMIKGESGYDPSGGAEDVQYAAEGIDQVIQDLGDMKALIVDVRFNGGGLDGVSLALASRFTDQHRPAFSYELRNGNSFTLPYEKYLEPGGKRQFTKPVFILTSKFTVGAGETFIL